MGTAGFDDPRRVVAGGEDMIPRTGMLLVCAVAALGGIGLMQVGLVNSDTGRPIFILGGVIIYLACVGAWNARGRK